MQKMNAKISWSMLYTLIGGLIFVLGLNLLQIIPEGYRDAYKIGLPVLLLLAYLVMRKYYPSQRSAFLAFFLVSLGWTIDYFLTGKIKSAFSLETSELSGIAITMVISTLLVCVPVLVGWLISGQKLSDLFIQSRTRMWAIALGLAGLFLFGGLGVLQSLGQGLDLKVIAAALPLALVFSLANGFREELTYRAALLNGLRANIGNLAAIIVTTLVFTLAHLDVSYIPPSQIIFAIVLVLIGVVGSLIMLKTGSLLGAVLFHAGADVLLILGLVSSQQLIL